MDYVHVPVINFKDACRGSKQRYPCSIVDEACTILMADANLALPWSVEHLIREVDSPLDPPLHHDIFPVMYTSRMQLLSKSLSPAPPYRCNFDSVRNGAATASIQMDLQQKWYAQIRTALLTQQLYLSYKHDPGCQSFQHHHFECNVSV